MNIRAQAELMPESNYRLYIDRGDILFHEGAPGDYAYILEKGQVEVSIARDGKKVILGRREAGEVVGEMAIIDQRPRSATITALVPSELIIISRKQIQSRIQQTDPVLCMCLDVILNRFRYILSRLQSVCKEETSETECIKRQESTPFRGNYSSALREIKLERELSQALEKEEFEPYFQPIIDLGNNEVVGFEALIRWNHKEKGLVPPKDFLATAEASGLIVPMGHQVIKHSFFFLNELRLLPFFSSNFQDLFVSINVTGLDFGDPLFLDQLLSCLSKFEIETKQVKLEITETVLLQDPEVAASAMHELKDAGFTVALDDFGTGYSSLSYLHKFPVDSLKIDRSFVRQMDAGKKNKQIIQSIIMLAEQLGLDVIAEGIESKTQEIELLRMGCSYGQGFYYSKPIPSSEVPQYLQQLQ